MLQSCLVHVVFHNTCTFQVFVEMQVSKVCRAWVDGSEYTLNNK